MFVALLMNLLHNMYLSRIFLYHFRVIKKEKIMSSLSNMNKYAETEDEPIDNLYLALTQCFAIILCG